MKQFWEEMPYGPIAEALRSTVGRCLSMVIVCVLGLGFGHMIAEKDFGCFLDGILVSPAIIIFSFFRSYGLLVWPLIFLLTWLDLILQLPRWVLVLPFFCSVWIAYDVDRDIIKNDPARAISKSQHT